MKNMVIKVDANSVFFKYVKDEEIVELFKKLNFIFVFLKKLLHKICKSSIILFYGNWKKKLEKVENIIIFDGAYSPILTNYIKRKNEHCTIHLYFYNVITNIDFLYDDNIDYVWSFDKSDVEKYNLLYNSTLFSKNIDLGQSNHSYDISFLGLAKNRLKDINEFQEICKSLNIITNFHVISKYKDQIQYSTYLQWVNQSKAILDITNGTQEGLTLRFMEGLFLEKKIITNNKKIVQYDFYDKNNIFILGVDNLKNLNHFINSDYKKIDDQIIDYYDYYNWKKRFFDIEKKQVNKGDNYV